jgi:hypothetical protein
VRLRGVTKRICLVSTVAATLGALSLLAGCGSGHQAVRPVAATSNVASVAQSTGPGSIPVVQTAREGQRFRLSYEQNGVPTSWQVTLDSVTCGDGTIFSAKVLAAAAESTGQSPPATPKPDQGQQFCLVKYDVTNDSTSNQPWDANDSTLNVGLNAYQSASSGAGADVQQDYMQNAQPASDTSDFGINPGVSAVSWAVFEIPVSAKVTSTSVPAGGATLDSTQAVVTATAKAEAGQTTASASAIPQPSDTAAPQPSGTAGCDDSCGQPEPVIFDVGGANSYDGVEPSMIAFSADGGNVVTSINWTTWNAETAVGHGSLSHNNCIPDCAQGTVTPGTATLTLSDPGGGTPTVWQSMVEQEDTGATLTWSYPGNWALNASGGYLPTPAGG